MLRLLNKLKKLPSLRNVINSAAKTGSFILLLTLYLFAHTILRVLRFRIFPSRLAESATRVVTGIYNRMVNFLDPRTSGSISRIDLIELALRNMRVKRTRTIITIGGMTIGIGAIVFLVSIGYGLQQLVVTRIARLEEVRQADISPQTGGKVNITDKTIEDVRQVPNVVSVLPMIAVVGRINYQSSITDIAVYGVTSEYLKQSAVKPVEGQIFESNEISLVSPPEVKVAGVSTKIPEANLNQSIRPVEVSVFPGEWVRVRSGPGTGNPVIGFTRRQEGPLSGTEVWGTAYSSDDPLPRSVDPEGSGLMPWVKLTPPLWEKDSNGQFKSIPSVEGFAAEINLQVSSSWLPDSRVLGEETSINVLASESAILDQGDDWVEIASEAGIIQVPKTQTVTLGAGAKRQAVVNRSMLKVLGLNENEAVGKTVSTSFVIIGDLLGADQSKTESSPTDYTIVGVVPDEKSPVMYVPFIDLRGLGIVNYSQLKLSTSDQSDLEKIRRTVESLGFVTRSVADTVSQVNNLFATLRTVLALLGMVALAVASLGMFNTLTVSLLERTREVGLMKAMGMKSTEVKELFLTESMIMGFFGGTIGVLVGVVTGKLLGILLSVFAVLKGVGFVDVSYVPPLFVVLVIVLSLVVGVLTGIYPARRATKISALNALRYE
jgi:ABC-type antimicrobial peptide transport system permease subunit